MTSDWLVCEIRVAPFFTIGGCVPISCITIHYEARVQTKFHPYSLTQYKFTSSLTEYFGERLNEKIVFVNK